MMRFMPAIDERQREAGIFRVDLRAAPWPAPSDTC